MNSNPLSITADKIQIRDWQLEDLVPYAHWLEPQHQWRKFDGPYFPSPKADEIPALMQKFEKRIVEGNWPEIRERLVISDLTNGTLIGTLSRYWECKETNWISIGISIYDPKHWGCGIGSQALSLWCDYLFEQLPSIVRLGFFTWSGNPGMMKVAEKLHFKEEACHRMARIVNDEYYDSMGYGLLRTEWEANK